MQSAKTTQRINGKLDWYFILQLEIMLNSFLELKTEDGSKLENSRTQIIIMED